MTIGFIAGCPRDPALTDILVPVFKVSGTLTNDGTPMEGVVVSFRPASQLPSVETIVLNGTINANE